MDALDVPNDQRDVLKVEVVTFCLSSGRVARWFEELHEVQALAAEVEPANPGVRAHGAELRVELGPREVSRVHHLRPEHFGAEASRVVEVLNRRRDLRDEGWHLPRTVPEGRRPGSNALGGERETIWRRAAGGMRRS